MGHLITVATCSLNQWALDFEGNLKRILESIRIAKEHGARLRVGPELEITGYGCYDHFLEGDTYLHSWEILAKILVHEYSQNILLDIGMPIVHKNVNYNCRVIILDGKILLIRPKLYLANDGNYREMRYFAGWSPVGHVENHYLPRIIRKITGQETVPIGDAVISTIDTCVGIELCEELFTPNSPHINMGLDGVEIFTNSSGSHHELRKLYTRIDLIKEATLKNGGIYLYANQQGCDGDRLYYDGCALIAVNGKIVAQGSQFSLKDVEVLTATIDVEDVRSHRGSNISRSCQAVNTITYTRIEAPIELSEPELNIKSKIKPTKPIKEFYHTAEQEIALGPACWLWDYLRRSKTNGYFLPLSGGIDSCATAIIVYSMCRLVVEAASNGDKKVISDVRRIVGEELDSNYIPTDPRELSNYMGTENSSEETRKRAKNLADSIGSYHLNFNIDTIITCILTLFTMVTNKTPKFRVYGGSNVENLALQNIQARLRMVLSYLFAQLLPWVRNLTGSFLRGYLTKYDCSSADINPIGAISKIDLRKFIEYARNEFGLSMLDELSSNHEPYLIIIIFLNAVPTAELEPITNDYVQSDEADMGMSYAELSVFGRLRKLNRCGPFSMFTKLVHEWSSELSPTEISKKVKKFYYYYSLNRHKMTTITPSYHAESYSVDDNRFDLRPFLYDTGWSWQFKKIDDFVKELEEKN
nr:9640_t:CDS:10 [Entrophospora candida]